MPLSASGTTKTERSDDLNRKLPREGYLTLQVTTPADAALSHSWMARAIDLGLARFEGTAIDPPKVLSSGN